MCLVVSGFEHPLSQSLLAADLKVEPVPNLYRCILTGHSLSLVVMNHMEGTVDRN